MSLRCAKAAINEGLETDLHSGMKVEEKQYAQVRKACHCNLTVLLSIKIDCTARVACLLVRP